MALTDPTGGVGYAWGQKLPSTHMTTLATQQPNALDAVGGGAWTLGSDVTINGTGKWNFAGGGFYGKAVDKVQLSGNSAGVRWRVDRTTIVNANGEIDTTADEYHSSGTWTANRTYEVLMSGDSPPPQEGERIRVRHYIGQNYSLDLNEKGGSNLISMGPGAAFGGTWVEIVYSGSNWYCSAWGAEDTGAVDVNQ